MGPQAPLHRALCLLAGIPLGAVVGGVHVRIRRVVVQYGKFRPFR